MCSFVSAEQADGAVAALPSPASALLLARRQLASDLVFASSTKRDGCVASHARPSMQSRREQGGLAALPRSSLPLVAAASDD